MPYVQVGDMRVWHEVVGRDSGELPPVVLLHGGLTGASSWSGQAPGLAAAGYQVFLPERRGHGHTPDVEGPISYDLMAQDTIAYLDQVVGRPAHLIGWSDGAAVALLAARQRPDVAVSLVLIGQYYNSSGRVHGGLTDALTGDGANEFIDFLRASYAEESPDGPEHFDLVFSKMKRMFQTEPEIELTSLGGITVPALVLQGDRDEVTLSHSTAVAGALPGGRLAVLPGTHLVPIESPELVTALLLAFLGGWPADLI
ncbi:MAG TPA: alpha/beta hydrolase [Streptosporangiaceae bacterium]